jgi:predicted RNase H-like HicB family nuclease
MRYLIVVEPTEEGFAVQVPDLAVMTHGRDIESARQAAVKAIRINLEAYAETGQEVPSPQPAETHLRDPDFKDLLFAYVEVASPHRKVAA